MLASVEIIEEGTSISIVVKLQILMMMMMIMMIAFRSDHLSSAECGILNVDC
jgi:hypothetical protein